MSDEKEFRQKYNIGKIESNITSIEGKITFQEKVEIRMDSVRDSIDALPHSDTEKRELHTLVAQLKEQLEQLSAEHEREAEMVADQLEALLNKLEAKEPDEEEVLDSGERLKKAAQNIAGVMPTVLQIATQIVTHASTLVG